MPKGDPWGLLFCPTLTLKNGFLYSYDDSQFSALRSGSLRVNYTLVASDTAQSAEQFAQSTIDLVNGTTLDVFGTDTRVQELEIERVPGECLEKSDSSILLSYKDCHLSILLYDRDYQEIKEVTRQIFCYKIEIAK